MYPRVTCTTPQAVTLDTITTRQIYDMAIRKYWRMPRTFDRTDPGCRYFHLIAHITPEQQRIQIAKWANGITRSYIDTTHQDILLRIMLSALPIGHNKAKTGHEHCPHPSCEGKHLEESVEHLFVQLPRDPTRHPATVKRPPSGRFTCRALPFAPMRTR